MSAPTPDETFPPALPLDGAAAIAAADDWTLILFAIGFTVFVLAAALIAAVAFARSVPSRYRRT